MSKQKWLQLHPRIKGHRVIEIVRYSNNDRLLKELGADIDGFEVTLNSPERINTTFNGIPDLYLEPLKS